MTSLEQVLWAVGMGLKLLLCAAVFYRRLYRRLPIFASYSVLLVGEVVFVWAVYRIFGYKSVMSWYAFWAASGLVLCARGAVIAELCWTVFGDYPGLWAIVRRTLVFSGGALLGIASVSAALNRYWIVGLVETTQRGLEFTTSVILVMTLAFSVRYKAWMREIERAVILGLTAYSLVEMLNHTFMTFAPATYLPIWDSVRVMTFNAAMTLWLYSLRKPLTERHPAPVLLTADDAAELMTEVLGAMRALNNEMKTLSRVVWK
jgi:hypothetical protein